MDSVKKYFEVHVIPKVYEAGFSYIYKEDKQILYSNIEDYANQRVIEELDRILSEKNVFGEQILQTEDVLLKRIKELKQP